MLEGSGSMPLGAAGVLSPTIEAGLRYDGGDAETGAGLEVGAGWVTRPGNWRLRSTRVHWWRTRTPST